MSFFRSLLFFSEPLLYYKLTDFMKVVAPFLAYLVDLNCRTMMSLLLECLFFYKKNNISYVNISSLALYSNNVEDNKFWP